MTLPRLLRTASFRLAALYVGVFAVSAAILGGAVFLAAQSALRQQMDTRVRTEVAFLLDELHGHGLARLLATVQARGRGAGALDYLVQDRSGTRLAGELPALGTAAATGWRTLASAEPPEQDGQPERIRALVVAAPGGLVLAVGDDPGRIADVEESVLTAFLWTVGLIAPLGIAGGLLLSRAFLARIDAITRTAEGIIAGDFTRRVPSTGTGDDLDRLAGTLNRMLDRIAALMDSLRQLGANVAHDLRTPLSRLYQRLDHARTHARTTEDWQATVEAAIAETEALLGTFAALLRIAQAESASPRAGFATVDLSELAASVAEAYRPDVEDSGHALDVGMDAGVVVHGDRELLTQALANLLENALRHTPAGTRITLRLRREAAAAACLVVADDGPGVSPVDLPHLPDRFYRGERSRTTPGNGLGLSLVAAVAELHGAALRIEHAAPGLVVALHFPG